MSISDWRGAIETMKAPKRLFDVTSSLALLILLSPLLVGTGPPHSVHRRQVEQLGVRQKVEFLGEVSDDQLRVLLHACTMLVLPSVNRSESFGIVQLEAMACRKPVVSTNLPTGVPWVNQDGRTGLVVPPGDVAALRLAIQRLLDNPDLRRQYGEEGRERVESEFTSGLHARRMLSLYEGLLNGTATLQQPDACQVRE